MRVSWQHMMPVGSVCQSGVCVTCVTTAGWATGDLSV